jgi:MFS family permease
MPPTKRPTRRTPRTKPARASARTPPRDGLLAHLRDPPGGRPARTMLAAQFLDRTGSGMWNSAAVLYFTVEAGLDARRVGLMLGAAAAAGVLGSPVAGRLAGRLPVRTVLIGCHLLRLCTLLVILSSTSFAVLLPAVAATLFGDRAAKTLEMLFAAEVAGPERATYQAVFRSVGNAALAIGAGVTAIGLTLGTRDAYRVLILLDALSFVAAAALVRRIESPVTDTQIPAPAHETAASDASDASSAPLPSGAPDASSPSQASDAPSATAAPVRTSPWRDRGYLRFVLLDVFMTLDDSILNVGLPLWLLTRTRAPHLLVPLFLFVNTVLVVALQMRVSAATRGPRDATSAARRYGVLLLACCCALALAPASGLWLGSVLLIAAACLVTFAELMRSVSSWELAVSLAPRSARPAYLGVAGMSQSTQKCLGPLLLTGAVLASGPAGWLGLGAVVLGVSAMQRRTCLRQLDRLERGERDIRDTCDTGIRTLPPPVDAAA